MFYNSKNLYLRNVMTSVASLAFLILTVWWVKLNPLSTDPSYLLHAKYIWGSSYQFLAIWGGICGLIISASLGGTKSFLGKSMIFFSIGLFLQSFGQSVYSYYNLFANIQAPYPSIGDIGYFGSIVFYILGVLYLARTSGVKVSLKSFHNKTQAVLIPLLLLWGSYSIFLTGYQFDWSDKLKVFLDFGYPLGQALYVSLAILTLILSRNVLGGIMKRPVTLFLIALIIQYVSDFNFLFQANKGTWLVAGYGDFLYATSYLVMTLSIISMGQALRTIKES